jgi:hypothetical protein
MDVQSMQSTPPVPQKGSISDVWQLPVLSQHPWHVAEQALLASGVAAS